MTRNMAQGTMPSTEKGTVPPRPVPPGQRRPREYLTPKEVERLISAARQNRYGHRDATMILIVSRHGLRVSELCALRWDQSIWVGRSATCPGCQPMVLGLTSTD
jgi:type 1 fimbriae regulatory protein FimB/type 1 fimbriae regulatory protein FimE